ncbi:sialidase family protein [Noviherbaspirillum agri]
MKFLHRTVALCLVMLGLFVFSTAAQDTHAHAQQKSPKPARSELGTSAAADAQGNLWVVSKEIAGDAQYVVLQVSPDLGRTWSAPRRIQNEPEAISADGENRPKIAFGTRGEIYITYTRPLARPYSGEIRFMRSIDGGKSFSQPVTVHANRDVITHRFDSLIVDRDGRIYVAWIDKRDLHAATARKQKYTGAAIYYAVSEDGGASFRGDYKAADHSCECCRIALALNPSGKPVAMWRHVFEPNVRDHALIELDPDGRSGTLHRASFEDWRIDACPHHGPALAYAADGVRHQAWFSMKDGEGGVYYAATDASGKLAKPELLGTAQASHADVAVREQDVVLAWKQFDGKLTAIQARVSGDGGKSWQEQVLATTEGASDQPRLVSAPAGIVLVWRTRNEGLQTVVVERRQK